MYAPIAIRGDPLRFCIWMTVLVAKISAVDNAFGSRRSCYSHTRRGDRRIGRRSDDNTRRFVETQVTLSRPHARDSRRFSGGSRGRRVSYVRLLCPLLLRSR